jgi:hypothetical protein
MAASESNPSPESKELALISKVEFRIAVAESETKLESLLNTYLAPLLLKLASEYASVRNKVRGLPLSFLEEGTSTTRWRLIWSLPGHSNLSTY